MIHRSFSVGLLALSLLSQSSAQTTNSSILGSVSDSFGAAIPGSAIVLTNTATGGQRQLPYGPFLLFLSDRRHHHFVLGHSY